MSKDSPRFGYSNLPQDLYFVSNIIGASIFVLPRIFIAYKRRSKRRSQGDSKKENFDHATPMAVVLRAAAAQHRARQAQPDEFHIRSVSLGLRASLYLEPIPATP